MQVPKFRCTDKLYVQLTYFHCTAFKIKNQPFASNVLTAVSMPAVCGCKKPAAFRRRDHKGDFHRLTERVPARAPRDLAAGRARRRDHKGDFHRLTERVPARAPRDFAAARCRRAPRDFAAGRARRRDHKGGFLRLTERVPARAPRDFAAGRARRAPRDPGVGRASTSVRGRRRFRVGCTRKYRARRPTCTNGIPPRCGSSSLPPASSSVCRRCGG